MLPAGCLVTTDVSCMEFCIPCNQSGLSAMLTCVNVPSCVLYGEMLKYCNLWEWGIWFLIMDRCSLGKLAFTLQPDMYRFRSTPWCDMYELIQSLPNNQRICLFLIQFLLAPENMARYEGVWYVVWMGSDGWCLWRGESWSGKPQQLPEKFNSQFSAQSLSFFSSGWVAAVVTMHTHS